MTIKDQQTLANLNKDWSIQEMFASRGAPYPTVYETLVAFNAVLDYLGYDEETRSTFMVLSAFATKKVMAGEPQEELVQLLDKEFELDISDPEAELKAELSEQTDG